MSCRVSFLVKAAELDRGTEAEMVASQEVAPQIALRDCAEEVGRGRSVCRGSMHFPPFCFAATEICGERWTTVTAQFYLESKGKYILEA